MKTLKKIIAILLFVSAIVSCRKEEVVNEPFEKSIAPEHRQSGGVQSMVYYDAQYGVLVFNSLDDVYNLEKYLENQDSYDRGNTVQINLLLDSTINNGYTTNSQGNPNKVRLQDLQTLLENSHPLSEESLDKLIQTQNQVNFPISFISSLLTSNTPFSYETREKVSLISNIQNADKQLILDADENDLDKMDYVYEDFLELFPGYQSLYEKQVNQEVLALEGGTSPASIGFDNEIFTSDFEQLIRNEQYEVYINGEGLLKAYKDCLELFFRLSLSEAYSELQHLDPNGDITIPSLNEGPQGISMSVINQSIPSEFITFSFEEYDPFVDESEDDYYGTALQEINVVEYCPVSNYAVNFDAATSLTATFSNYTYYPSVPSPPTTHQYWNFGDGTGSFLANPIHTYSTPGWYTVTLTTFSTDCGCFHQHKTMIYAGPWQTRAGNPDCEIFLNLEILEDYPVEGTDKFRLEVDGAGIFASITYEIVQRYPDGTVSAPLSTGTAIPGINYIDPPSGADGVYQIHVITTRDDGCFSDAFTEAIYYSETNSTPTCCSRKEEEKDEEEITHPSGDEFLVKYKDIARGRFYKTVGGYVKAYKKNGSGKFKKVKADHSIQIVGDVYAINGNDECTTDKIDVGYVDGKKVKNFSFESFQVWEYNRPKFGVKTPINFHHYVDYGPVTIWNDKIITLTCQ